MKRLGKRATHGLAIGFAAAGVFASLLGGCQQTDGGDIPMATEPICTATQAISSTNLYGTSLPMKTLSLSFDDGPGARTAELSTYLAAQGIAAAFFVNGKMLGAGSTVLQQLVADGHVVANHTQTHASLTGRATGGAALSAQEIVAEVAQTDALIAPFVQANRFMFRAPYGDFDAQTAAAVDASAMKKYVGPINWDIGDHMGPDQAADWDCWRSATDGVVLTTQQCGDLYVKEIDSVGRGIVLLHDPYFVDADPAKGATVDMIKYIVPILKTKGYKFVRLDDVPDIATLLPAAPADAGADGAAASRSDAPSSSSSSGASGSTGVDSSAGTAPCAPRNSTK